MHAYTTTQKYYKATTPEENYPGFKQSRPPKHPAQKILKGVP